MPAFTITRWADGALLGTGVADNPNTGDVHIDIIDLVVPPAQWSMVVTGQIRGIVFTWDEEEP